MGKFNKCCCCPNGTTVPRWQNLSKVRPAGDSGGVHYTSAPFPRLDGTSEDYNCTGVPAGTCGSWLTAGDFSGLSSQEIASTVNDIMACAAPDATHRTVDENCYYNDGTSTVNMKMAKRQGGMWGFGEKVWHGTHGFISSDTPSSAYWSATALPDQVKYLRADYSAILNTSYNSMPRSSACSGYRSVDQHSGALTQNLLVSFNGTTQPGVIFPGSTVLDPTTGITAMTGEDGTYTTQSTAYIRGALANPILTAVGPSGTIYTDVSDTTALQYLINDFTTGPIPNGTDIPNLAGSTFGQAITDFLYEANYFTTSVPMPTKVPNADPKTGWTAQSSSSGTYGDGTYSGSLVIKVTRSNTGYSWSVVGTSTVTYDSGVVTAGSSINYSGSITLSQPYSAQACWQDFLNALKAHDFSNFSIANLRTDEQMANGHLLKYDEVTSPVSPLGFTWPWVDNLAAAVTNPNVTSPPAPYTSGWQSNPWFTQMLTPDPAGNNAQWKMSTGAYEPIGAGVGPTMTAAATLIPSLYSGAIIGMNPPGSDRHFWFGNHYGFSRQQDPTYGFWYWDFKYGEQSNSSLPTPALRWLNKDVAQYDPLIAFLPCVYPQQWWNYTNGRVRGGKYVEAVQKWNPVDYSQPCGARKYDVSQKSVCCITASAAGSFTVKQTGNYGGTPSAWVAIAPVIGTSGSPGTATGGLRSNDFIINDDPTYKGIYKISGIASADIGSWTISVGSKLDSLPTGFVMLDVDETTGTEYVAANYLGRLRWPMVLYGSTYKQTPGIAGRAAITTSFASGTITINSSATQPYLRYGFDSSGALGGGVIAPSVDIYDNTMTLLATLTLTRVNDSQWTATSGSALPTAAWMVSAGVDWTLSSQTRFNSTKYTLNQTFTDVNQNVWRCTGAGTTASTAPTFPASGAGPVTDGTVTWTYDQRNRTGVFLQWHFNQRMNGTGYPSPPTWFASKPGCLSVTTNRFVYPLPVTGCTAMVGITPYYSPTIGSGPSPIGGATTLAPPAPLENFKSQVIFDFQSGADVFFDDVFGAHGQSAVMLTMPDPYWERPFMPDCNAGASFNWAEDDGSGKLDDLDVASAPRYHYFAHHPLVQASSQLPPTYVMPIDSAGVQISLLYDPTQNAISPPYYNPLNYVNTGTFSVIPGGIPLGDSGGDYGSVESNWGDSLRCCATIAGLLGHSTRFSADYLKWNFC